MGSHVLPSRNPFSALNCEEITQSLVLSPIKIVEKLSIIAALQSPRTYIAFKKHQAFCKPTVPKQSSQRKKKKKANEWKEYSEYSLGFLMIEKRPHNNPKP